MSKFKDLFLIVEGGHFSDREIKKENKKKVRGKDMTKFFVKKPYFVLVTVIIVLVIGFVSLGEMQTDLLPKMELPYMAVITTEVGASPEKVESDVVKDSLHFIRVTAQTRVTFKGGDCIIICQGKTKCA